ncbi:unnamed protein product [Adineta steineri]|uniref:ADP ribosyltransferase domain-containing protein n=1 Tax=Adineta steineri TaxID=433720 RepID=A0A815N9F9_9BILA|nr:unnamed protein product [Adineta steineri]CAF4082328.1 unnamed protein product [Adineta steineri]
MANLGLSAANTDRNADNEHLELFCLVWLNANAIENRNTEQKLRSVINHIKTFQDVEQCQEYIEQTSQNHRLIIIISGQLGRELVPSIHKLRQVISIYIYCMDTESHKQWSSKFTKVKAIIAELDELVSRLTADHKILQKVEEPLSINIFTTKGGAGTSTTGVNGQFVFSQILIDCLLRLKSTETDKNELISYFKNQYQGNSSELDTLREFQEEYSPDKALWWYTRDSFFYKTLNAALRNQEIHMIFLFRSFIFDIHRQLQHYQSKHPLTVYRSQMMSTDELKTLKESLGQLISINSFFSTSTSYSSAHSFLVLSNSSLDLQQVLFEIYADPKMVTTKPFAEISKHSYFSHELEVLFMLGSIFRLNSVKRNDDKIWIIRMTLCSDDEHDLKQVLMHMKQQIGNEETNLRTLGKALSEMGKPDLAEKYFCRLLNELPPNDPLLGSLYEDLGKLASSGRNYDMSMHWHKKSLEFKEKNQLKTGSNNNEKKTPIGKYILSKNIHNNTKWKKDASTVAGGRGYGSQLNELFWPEGIYIDHDDATLYVADCYNHRIVKWKYDATAGQVVVGGNKKGDRMDQLNYPTDVVLDQNNDFLIIADRDNNRVVRWSRRNIANQQTIISNINCYGLTIDNKGHLYVSDIDKNEVRRWKIGDTNGTVVAGANGKGNQLNQLNFPTSLFVDQNYSVYVSDRENHRVMKWMKGAKEGIVVAGRQGEGNNLAQLSHPQGVIVDHLDNVYVADSHNNRIVRWPKDSQDGTIIVGENRGGKRANQLDNPTDIALDEQGNIYVVDFNNHRVQKFDVE